MGNFFKSSALRIAVELQLWKRNWCDKPIFERPTEIAEAYSNCNQYFFPNILFFCYKFN